MAPLPHDRYCDEVVAQTDLLTGVLAGADLSATVPTTPDWTLADLARHIGGNLRSVEQAVRTGTPVTQPASQVPDHAGPPGVDPAAIAAWLSEAATACAAMLRQAGPDGEAQVWTVRWRTAAWARRAAHDLVVHRADAAGAVGAGYAVAPDLAADAIDEFLDLMRNLQVAEAAAAQGGGSGPAPTGTIHLHATDAGPEAAAEWLVELDPPGFRWRHAHEKATVAARGPLVDVLRVVTRRLPPDAKGMELLGDRALLDAWLERLVLR